MKMGIVGAGRMGWALAKLGRHFGDSVSLCVDIDEEVAKSFAQSFECPWATSLEDAGIAEHLMTLDALCLSVTDDAIAECVKALGNKLPHRCIVFHTSGVLSSSILKSALPQNACASLHPLAPCPLISATDIENLTFFRGLYFAAEGDEKALTLMRELVARLKGRLIAMIPQDKAKYHAAAVFASNYPLVLVNIAARLFADCGFEPNDAQNAAKSLFLRASHNLAQSSIREALTGPAKRGDTQTIDEHLKSLATEGVLKDLYTLLLDESYRLLKEH